MTRPLRVCYFGTYRERYARNQILLGGLRLAGVEVVECHVSLWSGIEDRLAVARGGWASLRFILRLGRAYWTLWRRHSALPEYDVLLVGYPGQLDVYWARFLAWWRRKPLVWDTLLSMPMMAQERRLATRNPMLNGLLQGSEKLACLLSDRIILQTETSAAWYRQTYELPPHKIWLIPVVADDRVFTPQPLALEPSARFRVLYYGSFIANHGVEHIVAAARLVADDPTIQFEMIGDGPERLSAEQLATNAGLTNVTFSDWLNREDLVRRAAQADICLGIFGDTLQSQQTLHNKVFEGLAMARPVITGDAPAIREVLQHGEHVYLCERNNPQALAHAIRILRQDAGLRQKLAKGGYEYYRQHYTVARIGERLQGYLLELIGGA